MIEDVLARVVLGAAREVLHVADVRVRIDQGRNDCLAGQIDPGGTLRCLNRALSAYLDEPAALYEKRGILDRHIPVACDQAGALVERHPAGRWCRPLGGDTT